MKALPTIVFCSFWDFSVLGLGVKVRSKTVNEMAVNALMKLRSAFES